MLTKNDLQQIRSIVREEVKDEVKQQLKPVSKKLNRVAKDLSYVI
jgi:predicted Zn-ribbon and HTH transcriptional regulator